MRMPDHTATCAEWGAWIDAAANPEQRHARKQRAFPYIYGTSNPSVTEPVIDPEKVKVEATRQGVRIHIPHDDSDSLVVLDVNHGGQTLSARLGVRGNFDMTRGRSMRWVSTYMDAPLVSADRLAMRKAAAFARGRAVRD